MVNKKLLFFILSFFSLFTMQANTLFVKHDGVQGGTGASWNDAFLSIADAMAAAKAGDQIFVAAGTYAQTWGKPKPGVSLYGGFAGTEQHIDERKRASSLLYDFAHKTVITVKGAAVLTAAASLPSESQLNIDGFIFKECTHNAPLMLLRGGVHLRNCQFIDCTLNTPANAPGTSNLVFFNLTAIAESTAAISASITDCLFDGNTNHQNQSILGVTPNAAQATGIVESCVLRNNVTDLAKGATNANILATGGTKGMVSVRNCRIYNNSSKQAAINSTINSEFINCMVYNNDCGTNTVLLAGKMYNSLVANNSSRFCFNNNAARLYNSAVVGNAVAGFAVNKVDFTTFEVANSVTDKKVPSTGIYAAVDIYETLAELHFVNPTSFQGKAVNAAQQAELVAADWNILSTSPLLNAGLTKWFTASGYGVTNNYDNTNQHVRYYFEKCDINALEADKYRLSVVIGEGAESPSTTVSFHLAGKEVTLTTHPLSGYTFKGWADESGAIVSTDATYIYRMPAADKTLTALFDAGNKKYMLTLATTEGGTIQQGASGEYYPEQAISLMAKPSIGYRFDHWSDATGNALSSESTYTYIMPSENATVTAHFAAKNDDAAGSKQFDFEGVNVSSQWTTTNGSLQLTDLRAQSGTQSLLWDIPAQAESTLKLEIETPFATTVGKSCYFNLYTPDALPDARLEILFYNENGKVVRKAIQSMNFIGWREFERNYNLDFEQKSTSDKVKRIAFILHNPSAKVVKLYFDRVNVEDTPGANKCVTDWYSPQASLFADATLLKNYALIDDATLPFLLPSAQEVADLNVVKARYPIGYKGGNIQEARTFITGLHLTRNADGSINGVATPLKESKKITITEVMTVLRRVETLAHAAQTSATDRNLLNDYLDYILEQDFLYRANPLMSNDYTAVRNIGQLFVNGMKACQNERQERAWVNLMQWTMSYGHIYRADYLKDQNSDVIHNMLYCYMPVAANCTNQTLAVRELKGIQRYLNRATEITPGGADLIKPDGSSFHHATHYPNYMYAFRGWIDAWHATRNTSFRPTQEAYEQLKRAVMAMSTFATRGANGNYLANSMAGRNPFSSGTTLVLNKTNLTKLSELGGDIYNTTSDEEVDQFMTYLFDEATDGNAFDGFYAYNWSPAGVYRFGNWVATMRAPTTRFWGAEIYANRNRFGRYQSHGTLEILYNGESTASGYPTANNLGGWDWNVVPGATTVHYTSWSEMMPGRKKDARFDQFATTTNFSGALSLQGNGIFASDFVQDDAWGVKLFVSTGLRFKKSVFAFEGKLISLGSNITTTATPQNTGITATNLFQSYQPSVAPVIDGTPMTQGTQTVDHNSGKWILTPQSTGYYVPGGNDKISVFYGQQAAPLDDASDIDNPAKAVVAKAYINHGMKPTDKKYHFVVVPNADALQMQQLATKIGEDGGELYTINYLDETLHSLTYLPTKTTAYAFFAPKSGVNFGHVAGVESEMLLMVKEEGANKLLLGVCNPNLRPEGTSSQWEATATATTLILNDVWDLTSGQNVMITHTQNSTKVALNLTDGAPQYFELSKSSVGIDATEAEKAKVWTEDGTLRVTAHSEVTVKVYDVLGRSIAVSALAVNHSIALSNGIYMVALQMGDVIEKHKVIIK